jgi:hypothetical protein
MGYSGAFLRAAALGAAIAGFAVAATPPATAAVYTPQQALPANTIQQFLTNPSTLLTQYPNGGPQMITQVRDLAASDPLTLNALIGLLGTANPDQAAAIGTGLGQAAELAVNTDEAYATEIQSAVASAGNTNALVAYSAVVGGDIKLAAAFGGGGGGGGEEGTSQNGSFLGGFGGTEPNLHTFATNTADSFPTLMFTPGTPGTPSVSPSVP